MLAKLLKDAWFAGGLAVLVAVVAVSLVLVIRGSGDGASAQTSHTPATATAAAAAAVPTPRLDQVFLDARRKLDLDAIGEALADYQARFGGYPTTANKTMTLCHSDGDAGCQLKSIAPAMPSGDGFYDYWYRSDGSTFVLITRIETPVASTNCPADVPVDLAGLSLYCVGPKGGAQP